MRLIVLSPFKWQPLFGIRHLQHQRDQNSSTWHNSAPMCSGAISCLLHVGARQVGGCCHRSDYMDCTLSHKGRRISSADSWRLFIMEPSVRICWHPARRKKLQLGRAPPPWQQARDASFHNTHTNTCSLTSELLMFCIELQISISGNAADSGWSSKSLTVIVMMQIPPVFS